MIEEKGKAPEPKAAGLPRMTDDLDIIAKLNDTPNKPPSSLTAAELKRRWDQGPNAIKTYINETLIPAIEAEQDEENAKIDTKLDSATIKSAGIPEIVSPETLRSYFYGKRKETSRSWQLEISSGSNENIINALGGFPDGHTASEKWFLYINLPYTEAGGFVIHAQLEGRTNGLLYRQDQFATLDQRWHTTGWIQIEDVQANLEKHNAAPDSHADIREAIASNTSANAETAADLSQHKADQSNPHGVTAAQAGADPSGTTTAADCFDEAASPTSAPTTWYVPKDLPRPSGEVGMMIDVRWQNGHMDGLGYDVSLVWGAPGGADNEIIIDSANITESLTGEYSIPAEGTVRYQLIEQSGRKRWQYVSGVLLPRQFSSTTAADVADKAVHGMEIEYLPGMEVYVQMDKGNTADVMRLVPANGPTLPVYGNGKGAKTGEIPAGYILHLVNAGDHWQIVNQAPPTKLAQLEGDANHRTVTDEQMRVWDSGGSEVADASAEKWATVKVEQNIPTITDMKTFEEFFYNKRKERARKYQFEWSQGGIHQNIYDVLGLPVHAPEDAQYFYYVEIPFSEAGGFIIHVTLEGRTNGVLAERKLYSTLNSRWNDTGWYQPTFIAKTVIAPHGAGSKADMTASEIINAARKGVVLADYTDPKTEELRTYQYFKQMKDGRACFAINGYIEAETPKQTLIYVDYAGNVTTETRNATAEGVGARPDTWTPTAKEVGAAPAGYGVGESYIEFNATSGSESLLEWGTRLAAKLADKPDRSCTHIWGTIPRTHDKHYVYCDVFKYDANELYIHVHTVDRLTVDDGDSIIRIYTLDAGACYEEWIDPPMKSGIEYRTTERYEGKPVYTKRLFDVAILPGVKTSIPINSDNVARVLDVIAVAADTTLPRFQNSDPAQDPANAFVATITPTAIGVWCGSYFTGMTHAVVKYTKKG